MTIDQFKKAFYKIKSKGFVKSTRRGPTGIGHTLERLLGVTKIYTATPDLGFVELKTHSIGSTSIITLFTLNREAWKMNPLVAIKKYGTRLDDGRLGIYFTMTRTPNSMGLFLIADKTAISMRHISGEVVAEWQLETIAKGFMQKNPGLILVSAFSEMRGDMEWFKYDRAQLLTETSTDIIKGQFLSGNVLFDIRMGCRPKMNELRYIQKSDWLQWSFKNWAEL